MASAESNKHTPDPESPTTVKPFEMDDDDIQEGIIGDEGHPTSTTTSAPTRVTPALSTTTTAAAEAAPSATSPTGTTGDAPPAKPPRPLTEQQKNEQILKEAFPSIDPAVIKAILTASGGRVDPAFNALLGMSDPDAAQNEPPPPPQPPRPTGNADMSQMEADEMYARRLAEHYDNVGAYEARTSNRGPGGGPGPRRQATGLKPDEMYDRDHSFIDDDLPVIKENLRKGFVETQTKVNSWFTNLKKKLDGEYDSEEDESQPSKHRPHGHGFNPGRRHGDGSRRSADYHRYDADPQVLNDDFAGMRLKPDGSTATQNRPGPGNPGIYRPPPPPSTSPRAEGRRVAFKEGHEDIDLYDNSPRASPRNSSSTPPPGAKPSKWQPMSAAASSPPTEHDPFSLGDSEDEKDAKKEIKLEDNERLKQATADAMADSLTESKTTKQ